MTIDNKLIRGDIRIVKTDANTGEPLAGAKFGLYQDGVLMMEAVSGEDGIAEFLNVAYGDYEIKEISAPAGYKLTNEVFAVSIRENGEVITVEIGNQPVPTPDIPKTGDDSNMTLWIILMGVSAAALVGTTVAGKRRKAKEDM